MLRHLNKYRFWFWKSLETYGLGIFFLFRQTTFKFVPPRPTLMDMFDDPPVIFFLATVSTLALVYALWDVNFFYYKSIMTGLLTAVWLFFMVAFVFHDLETGQIISFESMYAFYVLVSMVHEIVIGDD